MIFKRFAANLRAQNWFAIAIEVAIVVLGVFIGTQVSNWNEERLERVETLRMLDDLKPQLVALNDAFGSFNDYYVTTRAYASTALAGWRGDHKVSDREFVVAAYQASQITSTGMNNNSWSQIFGNDRLRELKDERLKADLAQLMTVDYEITERELYSDYRMHVRAIIPVDVQDAIRAQCGDKRMGELSFYVLPPTCRLDLPEERIKEAAAKLRQHPELTGELTWHFAAVAAFLDNNALLQSIAQRILKRIDRG